MTTNTTKFNVKKVTEKDGKKVFSPVATAIVYEDGKAGIIKSEAWGDLKMFRKEKEGAHGEAIYSVKKSKPTKEEGKSIANEVGTFIVRTGKQNGVLFLHLLDDSFAVFVRDPKEKDGTSDSTTTAAAA